jgi:Pilin accessory protein (PilO)
MRIVIGKRSYVTGLFWQSWGDKYPRRIAKGLGKKLGYPYVCRRRPSGMGGFSQAGFITQEKGVRWGLPSVAAALADQASSSWIGAWKVGTGYLVVSVRDNLIEPEGDVFLETEKEARRKVETEIAKGPYLKHFLPGEWGIENSEELSLTLLLTSPKAGLRYIFFPTRIALAGVLGLTILGVLAGGVTFYRQKQQRKIEEARLKEAKKKGLSLHAVLEAPPLWQQKPRPDVWLHACEDSLKRLPSNLLGGQNTALTCTGQEIILQWSRTSGTAETPRELELSPQGTTALSSLKLDPLPPRGVEKLAACRDNTRFVLIHDLPVTLTVMPEEPASSPTAQKRSWNKRSVSFRFQETPWRYASLLSQLGGLVLQRLEWSLGSHEWVLEGELYEHK